MSHLHTSMKERIKLGVIVPTTNTVNEVEWATIVSKITGVSIHANRIRLHESLYDMRQGELPDDLLNAMRGLQDARIDVIAYGCTAGSLILPLDVLTGAMREACGIPCTATGPALIAACKALGVSNVSIGTPYAERLNKHEREFFELSGIRVRRIVGLGFGAGGSHEYMKIAQLTKDDVEALAISALAEGGDALILSCTDLPTLSLLPELEERFGIPVISSNLATLWTTLPSC